MVSREIRGPFVNENKKIILNNKAKTFSLTCIGWWYMKFCCFFLSKLQLFSFCSSLTIQLKGRTKQTRSSFDFFNIPTQLDCKDVDGPNLESAPDVNSAAAANYFQD